MMLWTLLACHGDDPTVEPPRDTGPVTWVDEQFTGPTTIQTVTVACDAEEVVTVHAVTQGWALDGVVYAIETAASEPWAEEHDLASYEYDPFGWYDKLAVELDTAVPREQQRRDESSAFGCGDLEGADRLTYAVAVRDLYGDPADCVAWGHDPQAVVEDTIRSPLPGAGAPSFDPSACHVSETAR